MKKVVRITSQGKVEDLGPANVAGRHPKVDEVAARVALSQALIPVAPNAVGEALQAELTQLAGPPYSRTAGSPGVVRWGRQRGSISLADQEVPFTYPRARDRRTNAEGPLRTYPRLQRPRQGDAGLFRKVLFGLSCRNYEACAEAVPAAFGLSPSSGSRRFIRASAKQLQALQERRLEGYEFVALILDGESFAEDAMAIALGGTVTGEKVIRGLVQTATEEETGCASLLRELVERGLQAAPGLLCVIDGAKGLRKAIRTVFGAAAAGQRCQGHKRENVLEDLPKSQHPAWRRRLQAAYQKPSDPEAKAALLRVRGELRLVNASAVTSLDEGLEETLTLHRLGVFPQLGISLKTTNCLASLNALVGQRTDKVDRWRRSDQTQRWLAAALLVIEPRLRRIKGFRALPFLRSALQAERRGQVPRSDPRAA